MCDIYRPISMNIDFIFTKDIATKTSSSSEEYLHTAGSGQRDPPRLVLEVGGLQL